MTQVPSKITYHLKDVPNWSIVKLPDGRIGTVTNKTAKRGKPIFYDGRGNGAQDGEYLLNNTDHCEILLYPAQLACNHVERLYASGDAFCPACNRSVKVKSEDEGIGSYECGGMVGTDTNWVIRCANCGNDELRNLENDGPYAAPEAEPWEPRDD